jgi:hypothetical protein
MIIKMSHISLIRQIEAKIGRTPTLFEELEPLDVDVLARIRDDLIAEYNEYIKEK